MSLLDRTDVNTVLPRPRSSESDRAAATVAAPGTQHERHYVKPLHNWRFDQDGLLTLPSALPVANGVLG